jgi:hypothetical protein
MMVKKKKVTKMPNPTFVKFAGWKLFSQEKEIEHEEFFITDLKNVESGGNFPVFFQFGSLREIYTDLRNIDVFFLFIGFSA